jgi:hypothetical protein
MKKRNLTRQQIIEFSFEYAKKKHWKDLNLKMIAEHFDVKTPSLYNHIESIDDLLGDLRAKTISELGLALSKSILGVSGKEAIKAISHSYRSFAKSHPGVYDLTIEAPINNENHKKAAEELLETLLALYKGLPKKQAIQKIRILRSMLHGFVSLENGKGFGLPVGIDETFELMVNQYLVEL